MTLKELRGTSANPYDVMIVTVKNVANLQEHETICGLTNEVEMFLDVDNYPVTAWEIKIGLGGVPYLSVQIVHE